MRNKQHSKRRRVLLFALAALAALAASSTSAMAESGLEAYSANGGNTCGDLTVEGNSVSGGCLSEGWSGPWVMYMFGSQVTTGCKNYFATRTATDGTFYATNTFISGCSGIQRIACPKVPWPGEFTLQEAGVIVADMEMCVTSPSNPTQQSWVPIHYSVSTQEKGAEQWMNMYSKEAHSGGLYELLSEATIADSNLRLVEL